MKQLYTRWFNPWPLYPRSLKVTNNPTFEFGSLFHHPKKVTIAELPGTFCLLRLVHACFHVKQNRCLNATSLSEVSNQSTHEPHALDGHTPPGVIQILNGYTITWSPKQPVLNGWKWWFPTISYIKIWFIIQLIAKPFINRWDMMGSHQLPGSCTNPEVWLSHHIYTRKWLFPFHPVFWPQTEWHGYHLWDLVISTFPSLVLDAWDNLQLFQQKWIHRKNSENLVAVATCSEPCLQIIPNSKPPCLPPPKKKSHTKQNTFATPATRSQNSILFAVGRFCAQASHSKGSEYNSTRGMESLVVQPSKTAWYAIFVAQGRGIDGLSQGSQQLRRHAAAQSIHRRAINSPWRRTLQPLALPGKSQLLKITIDAAIRTSQKVTQIAWQIQMWRVRVVFGTAGLHPTPFHFQPLDFIALFHGKRPDRSIFFGQKKQFLKPIS